MFDDGLKHASSASTQNFISIRSYLRPPLPFLMRGLIWCTLTSLAHSLPPMDLHINPLTCIDQFTQWPEANLIINITAETVAQAFVSSWIGRFGVASTISTDSGRQFDSCLWNELMQLLGSKRIRTTAYHPSFNGLVERFHWQLKASVKAHTDLSNWSEKLPLVLHGICSALKEDLCCTVAELVYGTTLHLPGEFFNSTGHTNTPDPASYVIQLKVSMQQLWGSFVQKQPQRKAYIGKDMVSTTRVCTSLFVSHFSCLTKVLAMSWSKLTSTICLMSLVVQKLFHWIALNQLISKAILLLWSTRLHRQHLQHNLQTVQ